MIKFFLPVLFSLILFSGTTVVAQQQQDQAGTLLPDINPQDIEIRGDFQARFPGLSRQPILGFNPRPRVFQIDPNRMPFIESIDEVVATVSITDLEEPLTPEANPIYIPEKHHTFARLGFGRFISPEVSIQHENQIADGRWLTGDANFHAADSHTDMDSDFFQTNLDLAYIRYQNNKYFKATAGFLAGSNFINNTVELVDYISVTRRSNFTLHTDIAYKRRSSAYDSFSFNLGYRGNASAYSRTPYVDHYSNWPTGVRSQRQAYRVPEMANLSIAIPRPFREFTHTFTLGALSSFSGSQIGTVWNFYTDAIFDNNNLPDAYTDELANRLSSQTGISYERQIGFATKARLIGEFIHIHNPVQNQTEYKFYPGLGIDYTGIDQTKISLLAKGYVFQPTAYENYLLNPYNYGKTREKIEFGYTVDLNVNYQLFENLNVFFKNKLRLANNLNSFLYITTVPGGGLTYMYETTSFENAWILTNSVGVAYDFVPDRFTISGQAEINSGKVDHGEIIEFENSDIPNVPSFAASVNLFASPINNFYITSWVDFEHGKQTPVAGRDENTPTYQFEDLPSVALLNLQLDYRVSSNFGLYLKGLNLLNQEYEIWKGYRERPLQIYGGITIRL